MNKKCSVCGGNSPYASSRCEFCGSLFPVELKDGDSSYYKDTNNNSQSNVADYRQQKRPANLTYPSYNSQPYTRPKTTPKKKINPVGIIVIIVFAIFAFIFIAGVAVSIFEDISYDQYYSEAKEAAESIIAQKVETEKMEEISEQDKVVENCILDSDYVFENEKYYIVMAEKESDAYIKEQYNIYFDKKVVGNINSLTSSRYSTTIGNDDFSFDIRTNYYYENRAELLVGSSTADSLKRLDNLEINRFVVEVYYEESSWGSNKYTFIIVPQNENKDIYVTVTCEAEDGEYINYKKIISHIDYNQIDT